MFDFSRYLPLSHASAMRGTPGCTSIMQPTAKFVNYVYTTKFTQYFRWLGKPLLVMFPRAARGPTHNNGGIYLWKHGFQYLGFFHFHFNPRDRASNMNYCAKSIYYTTGAPGSRPQALRFRLEENPWTSQA